MSKRASEAIHPDATGAGNHQSGGGKLGGAVPGLAAYPKLSIYQLGRAFIATRAAVEENREAALADDARRDARSRFVAFGAQEDALRTLITVLPARSTSDAVMQVWVGLILAHQHLARELPPETSAEFGVELAETLRRLLVSALPVLARAGGLSLARLGWEGIETERAVAFGLEVRL